LAKITPSRIFFPLADHNRLNRRRSNAMVSSVVRIAAG
jgi:hypothetical protein